MNLTSVIRFHYMKEMLSSQKSWLWIHEKRHYAGWIWAIGEPWKGTWLFLEKGDWKEKNSLAGFEETKCHIWGRATQRKVQTTSSSWNQCLADGQWKRENSVLKLQLIIVCQKPHELRRRPQDSDKNTAKLTPWFQPGETLSGEPSMPCLDFRSTQLSDNRYCFKPSICDNLLYNDIEVMHLYTPSPTICHWITPIHPLRFYWRVISSMSQSLTPLLRSPPALPQPD